MIVKKTRLTNPTTRKKGKGRPKKRGNAKKKKKEARNKKGKGKKEEEKPERKKEEEKPEIKQEEEKPIVKIEQTKTETKSVLLVIYIKDKVPHIDSLKKLIPNWNDSNFIFVYKPLKIAFAVCETSLEYGELSKLLEKGMGDGSRVDVFDADGTIDPFCVLAGPGQSITAKDAQPILRAFSLKPEQYASIILLTPSGKGADIYAKQVFSHLEIDGKKIMVFDSIIDVPAVNIYGLKEQSNEAYASFLASIKSPKLIMPSSNFVQFMNTEAANRALELNYKQVGKNVISVVKVTYPPMKSNKVLNLTVKGFKPNESEKKMFDLLKPMFKGLAHVWRFDDEYVNLFFLSQKEIKEAIKIIRKGLKVGNTKIYLEQ
jgi:hypothetical protein